VEKSHFLALNVNKAYLRQIDLFSKIFQRYILWKICNKVVTNIPPHLNCVAVLPCEIKICKIHWCRYELRVWSLIFDPSCMTVSSFNVYEHRKCIKNYIQFNLNKNISKILFYNISFCICINVIIVIFASLFSQGSVVTQIGVVLLSNHFIKKFSL